MVLCHAPITHSAGSPDHQAGRLLWNLPVPWPVELLFQELPLWIAITYAMGNRKWRGRKEYQRPPKIKSFPSADSASEHRMVFCPRLPCSSHPGLASLCPPRSFSQFECQVLGFLSLLLLPWHPQEWVRELRARSFSWPVPAKYFLGTPNCILIYKTCLRRHFSQKYVQAVFHPRSFTEVAVLCQGVEILERIEPGQDSMIGLDKYIYLNHMYWLPVTLQRLFHSFPSFFPSFFLLLSLTPTSLSLPPSLSFPATPNPLNVK